MPSTASRPAGPVDPKALDVGYLALFVGQGFADRVLEALAAAGHADLRFSHGFVIQHVVDADRTIGELALRMGVTQQGASKAVAELETLGYLERVPDPADARIRRVRLSARGRAAVQISRRAREKIEHGLATAVGAREIAHARRTLARILEVVGATESVRARRVRPPR
jgi:DNA-binding MarR family transcriptional regulator